MKVLYLDLNYPDHFEDYSIAPKRYGAGAIWAREYKQKYDDFIIAADPKSFDNCTKEEKRFSSVIMLNWETRKLIREGVHLKSIFPCEDIDIISHSHPEIPINTDGLKAICVPWALGYRERVHPSYKHVMLFNHYQQSYVDPTTKIHFFTLGTNIPHYQKRDKSHLIDPYIFQCTRHNSFFGSVEVAKACMDQKIKAIFAGPIDKNYGLMEYIDDKYTFYLGQISQEEKIELTRKARLYTIFQTQPMAWNLSAMEALSCGVPIAYNGISFWNELMSHRSNGYMLRDFNFSGDLADAFRWAKLSLCEDAYRSVYKYNSHNMVNDIHNIFSKLVVGS